MDGNRRWAKAHNVPSFVGHTKGYDRIHSTVKYARTLGIKHITFWAFSTENWNRSAEEVSDLLTIFRNIFKNNLHEQFKKEKAKICVFGDLSRFPQDLQDNVQDLIDDTKDNTAITVNIALNYGGREEILMATRKLIETKQHITEENFSNSLYSHGQPDPDLIIRTGGEQRLSGYLLWQCEYSELYFTKILWPDFDENAFDEALADFESRNRRFGT